MCVWSFHPSLKLDVDNKIHEKSSMLVMELPCSQEIIIDFIFSLRRHLETKMFRREDQGHNPFFTDTNLSVHLLTECTESTHSSHKGAYPHGLVRVEQTTEEMGALSLYLRSQGSSRVPYRSCRSKRRIVRYQESLGVNGTDLLPPFVIVDGIYPNSTPETCP